MQIDELLKLCKWFDENVKKVKIPQKYQQLHQIMTQNTNARNNQPHQPFESEKEALLSSLSLLNFKVLSLEQIALLEKLEIKNFLGNAGVDIIEDTLYRNSLDIAAATNKIGEISNKLQTAVQRFDQFKTSFSGLYSIDESEILEPDQIFMRIYFQGNSAIKNVADLKRLGTAWYDIGRGIAMANGGHPQDLQVIGAQKGSVILELAVAAGIATSLSTILLAGLKVTEKVLGVLIKVEELKAMKLSNKKIAEDLIAEAEKEKTEGIKMIVEETINQIGINTKNGGDKIASLEKSVKKLIEFTENGGKVDFIQPNQEEGEEEKNERKELIEFRNNCTEIRTIENKIKFIEHQKNKNNF